MTIDPSTLAPDTPVMARGDRDFVMAAHNAVSEEWEDIVRVGEWLPTDEQEVPRDEFRTRLTNATKVRVETSYGVTLTGEWRAVMQTLGGGSHIARVWVLDEPDPDGPLIERIAKALYHRGEETEGIGWGHLDLSRETYRVLARAVLAVVREDGAR